MRRSSVLAHIRHVLDARRIRPHFDVAFYLESHPDVRTSGMDPVLHYVKWGWREGRDPHPDFSTSGWIARHPELHATGRNPYLHHLTTPADTAPIKVTEAQIVSAIAAEFDSAWYLDRNPDVAKTGTNPLKHYIRYGAAEGRNPNPEFSSAYYLAANPDVAQAGLNPFWHYIVAGRNEGRAPTNPGGEKLETLSALATLEADVADWKARAVDPDPVGLTDLKNALATAARAHQHLIVTISHDNYRAHSGGVQLCIQFEEAMARRDGVGFVNFHPHQPLMRLAKPDAEDERLLTVMVDGEALGTVTPEDAVKALRDLRSLRQFDVVIHSLLGHSPEFVGRLLDLKRRNRALLWAHDQFLLCPNYLLQRNAITYCDAPPPDSQACGICKFGAERRSHLARLETLLARPGIEIISPSHWETQFLSRKKTIALPPVTTLPHATLSKRRVSRSGKDGPVRIAFAGAAMRFKGWTDFLRLSEDLRDPDTHRFYSFGSGEGGSTVKSRPVTVSQDDEDKMCRALEKEDIDIVLMWAHGPETFSFVGHEALMAGAVIVTNDRTGNVAALVRDTGRGVVLDFDTDLEEWFRSDACTELVRMRRATRDTGFALTRSGKSVSLLLTKESA